jgi:hypothetical protein
LNFDFDLRMIKYQRAHPILSQNILKMLSQVFFVFAFATSGLLAQQVNHNIEHAGRIQCNNPNVFRTKNFYNCVSKVLGTSGIIASDDQFAACAELQVNQERYYECICTKSVQIVDW